jgi:hypothetical protein
VQIFFLDQNAFRRQQRAQIIIGKTDHGKLMPVHARSVNPSFLSRLHEQTGQGVGAFVPDAVDNAINQFLKEIPGPDDRSGFRKIGKLLEPGGVVDRQLIFTAALFNMQNRSGRIHPQADLPGRKPAQKLHK